MKHIYPAVFEKEAEGGYSISFPDLEGCYSQGDTNEDAFYMAQDALALWLAYAEDKGLSIPKATSVEQIKRNENEVIALIECNTDAYHKKWANKSVKKTLTIPAWLNTKAEAAGINFSQALQEALKKKIV